MHLTLHLLIYLSLVHTRNQVPKVPTEKRETTVHPILIEEGSASGKN